MTSAEDPRPLYIMGDVHGQFEALTRLLREAGLIDDDQHWTGETARLWFLGDFFDRGPGSLSAVALVMRLQREAAAVGGQVGALLGNHEILFLGAYRFRADSEQSLYMRVSWIANGGNLEDLTHVTPEQIAWLSSLPMMARVDRWLLIHADAMFYTHYGDTIDEINARVQTLLNGDRAELWERLMDQFSLRMMFLPGRTDGTGRASHLLSLYGGSQIVHGHTPIHFMTGQVNPEMNTEAYAYAIQGGEPLCINVDGGLYAGGPGFLHRLK